MDANGNNELKPSTQLLVDDSLEETKALLEKLFQEAKTSLGKSEMLASQKITDAVGSLNLYVPDSEVEDDVNHLSTPCIRRRAIKTEDKPVVKDQDAPEVVNDDDEMLKIFLPKLFEKK